jgi:hypothetical protein
MRAITKRSVARSIEGAHELLEVELAGRVVGQVFDASGVAMERFPPSARYNPSYPFN